jgi:hypothetical protein
LAATTATGSPPNGSLTKAAQATTTIPKSPSAPASNWGAETGSFSSLFRLSWPRGAFRSSVAKAQDPRESSRESSTRRFRAGIATCLSRHAIVRADKTIGAAFRPPRNFETQPALSSAQMSLNSAGMPS